MGAAARFELSTISHGNRDPTTEIHETIRMRFPEQSNVETPRNDILKFKGIVPSIEGMNTIIWSDSDLLIQKYIYIYYYKMNRYKKINKISYQYDIKIYLQNFLLFFF